MSLAIIGGTLAAKSRVAVVKGILILTAAAIVAGPVMLPAVFLPVV
jgi:hypothetical protein